MKLEVLRTTLGQRFPEALPRPELPAPALAFGIPEIDAILPTRGLARGRLAEIVGREGSGRTSLAKSLVRTSNEPVALVDPERSLFPSDWLSRDVWVARGDELYCTDVLLRSRAFGLVVVFAALRRHSPFVRLQRLTEEAGSVCLFVCGEPQGSSLVSTRIGIEGGEWLTAGFPPVITGRRVRVTLEKGGAHRSTEVVLYEEETDRLLSHPEAPDRAPVAWRGAGGRKQAPRFARG